MSPEFLETPDFCPDFGFPGFFPADFCQDFGFPGFFPESTLRVG
jgi:hypothetical protein